MLQKLQVTYKFKLEDYMDGLAIRSKPLRKTVSCFFIINLFIHLFDVSYMLGLVLDVEDTRMKDTVLWGTDLLNQQLQQYKYYNGGIYRVLKGNRRN